MPDLDLGGQISTNDDYTWQVPETAWYLVHVYEPTNSWGDPSTVTLKQNGVNLTDLASLSADTLKVVALMRGTLTVTTTNITTDRPQVSVSRMDYD